MPLDSGELKARWKTDEGKELLQKVYTALQARAPCTDILAGFPGVEEIASGLDLRGADLSSASLSGADLSNADLSQANFALTVLRDADLKNANLSDANLSSANLSDANLSDANLSGTNLHGTNLRGADLSSADLSGATLRGADLRDAKLRAADLSDVELDGIELSSADLSDVELDGAAPSNADPSSADLSDVELDGIELSIVELDGVDLSSAELDGAKASTIAAAGEVPSFGSVSPRLAQKAREEATIEKTKRCPFCGEEILAIAKKCKHCQSDLVTKGHAALPPRNRSPKSFGVEDIAKTSISLTVGVIASFVFIFLLFLMKPTPDKILQIWGVSFWVAFLAGVLKGRGLFGFLLGITTGPVGAVVMVCFQSAVKKCFTCQKNIPKQAIKCPHCQTDQA